MREKVKPFFAVCTALLLSACAVHTAPQPEETSAPISEPEVVVQPAGEPEMSYVQQLADRAVKEIVEPGAPPEAQVRALYRALVEHVYFADPVGLDIWRYESEQSEAIPYLENRALSPLRFGVGSCEDFAAAMTLLLRAAGFQAEYVAGYTLSVDQVYVDHAWTVVQLEGNWYHLDPQLEQNVTRQNRLTYRYYLKSDQELLADHKWGENLIEFYTGITKTEAEKIRRNYVPPACPVSWPAPEAESIPLPLRPNLAEIESEIQRARSAAGELPPLRLNVEPPVLIADLHITPPLLPQQAGFCYGRSLLRGEQAQLYDNLAALVQAPVHGAETPVPAGIADADVQAVTGMFLSDHPLCYWADFSLCRVQSGRAVQLAMRLELQEIERRERLLRQRVEEILTPVRGADAFQQVLAIHDAVAAVRYDSGGAGADSSNVYGALVMGAATCDGYARAFQYLADEAGLETVYLRGHSITGAQHAWNAVRLDASWHFVDATWDRPLREYDDIYHDYFLMDNAALAAERIPDAAQYPELPRSDSGYCGYFERMGYVVSGPPGDSAAEAMAELLYNQLAAKESYPAAPQPVYLEFQVLGDEETYRAWKQLYIKQVFTVLQQVGERARKEQASFRVVSDSSVKCDFNDITQVLSFYPTVERMEESR